MKRFLTILAVLLVLLQGAAAANAEAALALSPQTTKLTAHFATVEEGRQLMRGRTLFHAQISESTLDFFLQRKGGYGAAVRN